ncbi:MAG: hypothetical protein ACP5KO_02455 [Caldimicrobium sp.]
MESFQGLERYMWNREYEKIVPTEMEDEEIYFFAMGKKMVKGRSEKNSEVKGLPF